LFYVCFDLEKYNFSVVAPFLKNPRKNAFHLEKSTIAPVWKKSLWRPWSIWKLKHEMRRLLVEGVAIGKPERHVRKASHCGSKQQ